MRLSPGFGLVLSTVTVVTRSDVGVIAIGGVVLCIWLMLEIFSLGFAELTEMLAWSSMMFVIGLGVIFLVFALRTLIEIPYLRREKRELLANPEGSEKYLRVLNASQTTTRITLIAWAIVVVCAGITIATAFNPIAIGVTLVAAVVHATPNAKSEAVLCIR